MLCAGAWFPAHARAALSALCRPQLQWPRAAFDSQRRLAGNLTTLRSWMLGVSPAALAATSGRRRVGAGPGDQACDHGAEEGLYMPPCRPAQHGPGERKPSPCPLCPSTLPIVQHTCALCVYVHPDLRHPACSPSSPPVRSMVLEVLPQLMHILAPAMRPVSQHLYSPVEMEVMR